MLLKIAFVFPGQGSQSLGMLAALAKKFPLIVQTFTQASDVLGIDLWRLIQEGPLETLNSTAYTQPILLACSIALARVWEAECAISPSFLAGHSLGEYSALVCAQSMSFEEGLRLVAKRGLLMQEAVELGQGSMAAVVGLEDAIVNQICLEAAQNQVLSPANYNAPGQIVIAGHTDAVARAIELAKKAGAKLVKLLPVSVPSHCALMLPAAEQLESYLQNIGISRPSTAVINNVDVAVEFEPDRIKQALKRQLYFPVRWVETMQELAAKKVDLVFEMGPGKVLTGLNKRITPDLLTLPLAEPEHWDQALAKIESLRSIH